MDVFAIRLQNYKTLWNKFVAREEAEGLAERGALNRFGEKIGVSPRYLSHVNNGRKNIGESTARKVEQALELPHGWMDIDHLDDANPVGPEEREFARVALRVYRAQPLKAQALMMKVMAEQWSERHGQRQTEKED